MIEFESKSIQKAIAEIKKQYGQLSPEKLNTAISRALNHTAQKAKTEASSNIRKTYNIGVQLINKDMKVVYSQPRTLTVRIRAKGSPLGWDKFQAKQISTTGTTTSFDRKGVASSRLNRKSRNKATKGGVTATIKKSEGSVNLPTAFIQIANGGITVFARGKYKGKGEGFEFSKPRLPIGKMTTTSIPLMFANDEVMKPTQYKAEGILQDRIMHEIKFILGQ